VELIFLLLFWVGLSAGVGALWQSRGRGFADGLLCSIFLSPLIGFIIGIAMRPNIRAIEAKQVSEGGNMSKVWKVLNSGVEPALDKIRTFVYIQENL